LVAVGEAGEPGYGLGALKIVPLPSTVIDLVSGGEGKEDRLLSIKGKVGFLPRRVPYVKFTDNGVEVANYSASEERDGPMPCVPDPGIILRPDKVPARVATPDTAVVQLSTGEVVSFCVGMTTGYSEIAHGAILELLHKQKMWRDVTDRFVGQHSLRLEEKLRQLRQIEGGEPDYTSVVIGSIKQGRFTCLAVGKVAVDVVLQEVSGLVRRKQVTG
jgi:hypothetical protein